MRTSRRIYVKLSFVIALLESAVANIVAAPIIENGYTYETPSQSNMYYQLRDATAEGTIIAIDSDKHTLTLKKLKDFSGRLPPICNYEEVSILYEDSCPVDINNENKDIKSLKINDRVCIWLAEPYTDMKANRINVLMGWDWPEKVKWFPDINLRPDKNGCFFFEDFETKDLSRWQWNMGCVSIITNNPLSGSASYMAYRELKPGKFIYTAKDTSMLYGFPELNDVWIKWKFKHIADPEKSGNYAVMRFFPSSGSQVFAVRMYAYFKEWRFGCQLANSKGNPQPMGKIAIEQGKVYELKLHWKKASNKDTDDGIVQTWVNGVLDIDDHAAASYTDFKLFRLSLGINHTGSSKDFGAMAYYDDIWIGDKDPDIRP